MLDREHLIREGALRLAVASADVSNYCDHAEHNEPADVDWVRQAAKTLRSEAVELAMIGGFQICDLYAARLAVIEARNVLAHDGAWNGQRAAREASTWRDLQLVQMRHDREYHPDVVGLSKLDQLRHYALHVAKLAGATAGVALGEVVRDDWMAARLPDMLLFGIKLSTVTGEKLPGEMLPRIAADSIVVAAS